VLRFAPLLLLLLLRRRRVVRRPAAGTAEHAGECDLTGDRSRSSHANPTTRTDFDSSVPTAATELLEKTAGDTYGR
jgi:hypothetical protein